MPKHRDAMNANDRTATGADGSKTAIPINHMVATDKQRAVQCMIDRRTFNIPFDRDGLVNWLPFLTTHSPRWQREQRAKLRVHSSEEKQKGEGGFKRGQIKARSDDGYVS